MRATRRCVSLRHPAARRRELTLEGDGLPRAEGLSVHKLPEQLEVVDALPRGETLRKVLKYELRERFSDTGG
ncbi:hypothetical protein CTZ28_24860 [Streptomyces shenzhenensis]|uniref:AMP-binding enzyme C-terminal domain-containing protein n=1 Tax=Streptomyces shenzhenensis TaxID=943815 RepID=A0A3M0IAL1_9ACTN|nr:hypothetical protein CTZ28_24860 [Streptomyces shenzhenensis]